MRDELGYFRVQCSNEHCCCKEYMGTESSNNTCTNCKHGSINHQIQRSALVCKYCMLEKDSSVLSKACKHEFCRRRDDGSFKCIEDEMEPLREILSRTQLERLICVTGVERLTDFRALDENDWDKLIPLPGLARDGLRLYLRERGVLAVNPPADAYHRTHVIVEPSNAAVVQRPSSIGRDSTPVGPYGAQTATRGFVALPPTIVSGETPAGSGGGGGRAVAAEKEKP